MPVTISREQRDAIYQLVMARLTGIGDVWIEIQNGNLATACRLGRVFAEELRLLDDLGWGESVDREEIALTLPPAELTRTIGRLARDAAAALEGFVSRPKDDEGLAKRDLAASAASAELLSQLALAPPEYDGRGNDDPEESSR